MSYTQLNPAFQTRNKVTLPFQLDCHCGLNVVPFLSLLHPYKSLQWQTNVIWLPNMPFVSPEKLLWHWTCIFIYVLCSSLTKSHHRNEFFAGDTFLYYISSLTLVLDFAEFLILLAPGNIQGYTKLRVTMLKACPSMTLAIERDIKHQFWLCS